MPTTTPHDTTAYEVSDDPARLDVALIHHWLSTDAYWALGRPLATQQRAIAASHNFGAYLTASGRQVGYARVITDHATFAWLCDVYIDPAHRGRGLGGRLVDAVNAYLDPYELRRTMLATHDAHEVYRRAGFRELTRPDHLMQRGPH
ncbi:GNAT family N-acetyltransferase [Streptomyces durbertensis]|uniref:GNAT family N-acetyltransferase n=2 Tax=Streptomyces durbertensis TaxID=2448886 RepID=A0ABR6EDW6_9ACTN|nr:GNAT family N-acetyltransferase [Streptomyces durbertensis]